MPDLSADAVSAWVRAHEPALAADVAPSIPSGAEHEAVLPAMLRLGAAMDVSEQQDPNRFDILFQRQDVLSNFQAMLPEFGLGRRLYLLNWLSNRASGQDIAATLLASGDSDAARFLRAEFQSLHRRALLARIFGPDRIKTLLDASVEATKRPHNA